MKTFAVKLIAVVATFIVTFCIIHTAMNHKKQFEPETIESETISDILAEFEESEPVELISEPESTTAETTTEETTISETTEYYEEDEPEVEYIYEEPEEDYDSSSHGNYIGEFQLTAYEWTGYPMANGEYPYYGACASNKFPLGTVLYIDGYGTFVVCDRGGMADNVIDIYLGDPEECDEFGRKSGVSVYYG